MNILLCLEELETRAAPVALNMVGLTAAETVYAQQIQTIFNAVVQPAADTVAANPTLANAVLAMAALRTGFEAIEPTLVDLLWLGDANDPNLVANMQTVTDFLASINNVLDNPPAAPAGLT